MKRIFNFIFTFFILASLHFNLMAQTVTLRPEIEVIVGELEKGNKIETSTIGFAGLPSSLWAEYNMLVEKATHEELLLLLQHKNPAVRCYAFQALVVLKDKNLRSLAENFNNDTASVMIIMGCVISKITVQQFCHDIISIMPKYAIDRRR